MGKIIKSILFLTILFFSYNIFSQIGLGQEWWESQNGIDISNTNSGQIILLNALRLKDGHANIWDITHYDNQNADLQIKQSDILNNTITRLVISRENGNVGIATEEPTEKLTINGKLQVWDIQNINNKLTFSFNTGIDDYSEIKANNGSNLKGLYLNTGNVGIGVVPRESDNYKLRVDGNVHSSGVVDAQFYKVNGSFMGIWRQSIIQGDVYYEEGRVGVGVIIPTEMLDVAGNIKTTGNITSNNVINANNYINAGNYIALNNNLNNNYTLKIKTLGDDNWGIEHSSEANFGVNNFYGMGLRIMDNGTNGFYIRDKVTNTNRLVIRNGKLGIGTDNPAFTLDVEGTINANNIYKDGQPLSTSQWLNNGNNIYYNTGAVCIGTSIPYNANTTLTVNGAITSKALFVKINNWPDFVFKESYNLKSLREVEDYIFENGHLEEVPSETEVSVEGVDLGEMSSKLLQKVEELTLYLIHQNKEIESLKKEIESLKVIK